MIKVMFQILLGFLIFILPVSHTEAADLPLKAQSAFDKAYDLLRKGEALAALPYYEEALSLASGSSDIWQEYGSALRQINHLQRAAKACWRSIELDESKPGPWANIANVFLRARSFDASYSANRRLDALSKDKKYVESQFVNVGYWAWVNGDNKQSERALRFVLDRNPSNVKAQIDYGILLVSQGKVKEGREKIEQGIKTSQDNRIQTYGKMTLQQLDEKGTLPRYAQEESYQTLPDRFINQPLKGEALNLKIDEYVEYIFPVQTIGGIKVTVPESWHEKSKINELKASRLKSIDLSLHPGDKKKFQVLITVVPFPAEKQSVLRDHLRQQAEKAVKSASSSAVEKNIVLYEISSDIVSGCYYFMTDKNCLKKQPNEEDYLYTYQGLFSSGKSMIVATALIWDLNDKLKKDIIKMFSSFRIEGM